MRTLTIILGVAFVGILLAQQLWAAPLWTRPGGDEASQAVVAGTIGCFTFDEESNAVALTTRAGLGVIGLVNDRDLAQAVDLSEECSDLIPGLAEQVPHRICEIGNQPDPNIEAFNFLCAGRADAVISAVGKMARTVTRLGHP